MRALFLLILLSLPITTFSATHTGAPDHLVETFLARDLAGGRLSPYSRQGGMADLVGWPKEPEWKVLVVVKDYKQQPVRRTPNGLQAVVEYRVLGELVDGSWVPRGRKRLERKNFLLVRENDNWKISKPMLPPHISLQRAIAEVKGMIGKLSGSGGRQHLRVSLAALEKLSQGG